MTAVVTPIRPEPHLRLVPEPAGAPARRPAPRRPELVVLDGGRSTAARRRRAVYRRRRLVAVAVVVVAAVVLVRLVPAVAAAVTTAPTSPPASGVVVQGDTYVARPGDTLWDVARALPVGGDVRDVVDRLAEVNGSVSVIAGQAIRIPADLQAG
jgi:hypothetical protein